MDCCYCYGSQCPKFAKIATTALNEFTWHNDSVRIFVIYIRNILPEICLKSYILMWRFQIHVKIKTIHVKHCFTHESDTLFLLWVSLWPLPLYWHLSHLKVSINGRSRDNLWILQHCGLNKDNKSVWLFSFTEFLVTNFLVLVAPNVW